jgi:beta-glucosidase/6-phospho-beta-glucosidase/beta-galactosidase
MSRREQRLKFWSDPDTEIKLAQATNVKVFRMGVDWTRIMPVEPLDGIQHSVCFNFRIT